MKRGKVSANTKRLMAYRYSSLPVATFFTSAADWTGTPLLLVLLLSLAVAVIMLLVFGRFSNQKELKKAKARLQAHVLSVRLFQDQLNVVLKTYPRILGGVLNYLRYALKPAAMLFIPLLALTVVLDPYFGYQPLNTEQNFLLTTRVDNPEQLEQVSLQLPPGLKETAPAVHVADEKAVIWRLAADVPGRYTVEMKLGDAAYSKNIVVGEGIARVTTGRWRNGYWDHLFDASESGLPKSSPFSAIEVGYAPRLIDLGLVQWNWIIVLFFAAIITALLLKKPFGVEI